MIVPCPLIKPKYYKSLLIDLANFVRRPIDKSSIEKSTAQKIYDTIGLFFIKIIFSITVASLLQLIYEPENLTSVSMSDRFGPLALLLVGGIILPIFEEITFRLSLKFSPINFALTSGTFTYYIMTKAVYKSRLSLVDDTFWYRIIVAVIILLIAFVLSNRSSIRQILEQFWKKHFRLIYYASCISFAWLHIFNFELNLTNLLLLPILTLPQLFSATIAGYTRVAFGLKYPVLLHMITNTLFLSLTLLPLD
ncbi:hypothetical protein BTO05_06000 [Winogradskyella sp. PC-19]|uniref:hypothetical protein n=1 Tax=unclassified Winogradskyella TaxID=2615021 RepID=UPI000B3C2FCD|nr:MULTISPECIES: hypothetical protein [unclassified Winogradskyella]ARV09214.1 hypothetical protein BTO05_06000 [Winogradskyella sp. PC-19]